MLLGLDGGLYVKQSAQLLRDHQSPFLMAFTTLVVELGRRMNTEQFLRTSSYLEQQVRLGVRAVQLLVTNCPRKFLGELSIQNIFVVPHRQLRELLS